MRARIFLISGLCLCLSLVLTGCQKLNIEKTVSLARGEIWDQPIDGPKWEQNIAVEFSSAGVPINVFVVLEENYGAIKDRIGVAKLLDNTKLLASVVQKESETVLATIPSLLGGHFERLHEAAQRRVAEAEAQADASGDAMTVAPGAWLDPFRKDMQSVLLAELDVRFQPVEGLLAALRTR